MADEDLPTLDPFQRIVNVHWRTGGEMLVLWVYGGKGVSAPSPPDPDLSIKLFASLDWFGWTFSGTSIESLTLTEKTRATEQKALFDTAPNRMEDYALFNQVASHTSDTTYTFIDRARYVLRNQHSGAIVTNATDTFGSVVVPACYDFTGVTPPPPDTPNPTFASPPFSPDNWSEAEAAAIEAGLPGVGWTWVLSEVLASHDEITSVTVKSRNKNRFVFIDLTKLKAQNPDAESFTIDVVSQFFSGAANQSFQLAAYLGLYEKSVQNQPIPPPPLTPDPDWTPWPVTDDVDDPLNTPGIYLNGSPYFFPPNADAEEFREPVSEVLVDASTTEGTALARTIRLTVDLNTNTVSGEIL